MVLARMSFWYFKAGKREEGFAELDKILNTLAQEAGRVFEVTCHYFHLRTQRQSLS